MTNPNGWREDVVPRFAWRIWLDGLALQIGEGGEIPAGYGVAYYEPARHVAVLMPMPLHAIVGAWRALRWHVICPPWRRVEAMAIYREYVRSEWDRTSQRIERNRKLHYDEGYRAGWDGAVSAMLAATADAEKRLARLVAVESQ